MFAKYRDFDSFFADLPPDEQAICGQLRDLILNHFPELNERFSYGAPFYHLNKRVCFIYPASLPYSGLAQGVSLGFNRGHLLSNAHGLLELGERKEVAYVRLLRPADLRADLLLEILHEAVLLDQTLALGKKR